MTGKGDTFTLSTGRVFYANNLIVGISMSGCEGNVLMLAEGYDGNVDTLSWTPAERRELADFMIDLWGKWRDVAVTLPVEDDPWGI